jgi:hypothetical protein
MKNTARPRKATEAQIDANRQNAQRSTGPRSAQGKDASSRNGLQHGLSGDKHILPGENPEEFLLLLKDLYDNFHPVGLGEEKLVQRIAADQWRLDRTLPMEAAIYRQRLEGVAAEDYARKRELVNHKRNHQLNPDLVPPAPAPPDPGDRLTRAFIDDGDGHNSLTRLARYETSIERSIDRCLRQLKAFQAARNTPHPAGPEPPEAPETKPETAHQTAPVPPDKEDYEANPKDDGQTHNPAQQPAETADRTEARGAKPPAETPVPAQPSPALP